MLLMLKEVCVWLDSYATERYRRETVEYRIGQEMTNRKHKGMVLTLISDVKFVQITLTYLHGFLNYKQTLNLIFADVFHHLIYSRIFFSGSIYSHNSLVRFTNDIMTKIIVSKTILITYPCKNICLII